MDPLMMALVGGSVATPLLTGLMGGQGMGDQQREAGRRSVELSKNQSLINSQTMSPFIGAGMMALQELYGYSPGGTAGATGQGGVAGVNVPTMVSTGDRWDSPTTIGGNTYSKTGAGVDPTGGAGAYRDLLKGYGTSFRFDPNNPAYQQQLAETTRLNDQALAARGMYNSRAGLNLQDQSARNLVASEYDKQYTRGYSNLVDLFNMSSQLGGTKYNSLLDAVKIGTGAGTTAGGLGNQAAGNLISSYGTMANAGAQSDAYKQDMFGALGAAPMNYLILKNLLGK